MTDRDLESQLHSQLIEAASRVDHVKLGPIDAELAKRAMEPRELPTLALARQLVAAARNAASSNPALAVELTNAYIALVGATPHSREWKL